MTEMLPHLHRAGFALNLLVTLLASSASICAKTPASIAIIGSSEVAEGSAEPFFARVTYVDASEAVVTAAWTNGFSGAVEIARIFRFPAPTVDSDQTGTLLVAYTEDAVTVNASLSITVENVALTGPDAIERIRHHPEPRPRSRAAYSVDAATGAHIIRMPVMSFRATVEQTLELNHHSLFTSAPGPLGPGWYLNYDLRITGDPRGIVILHHGRELQVRFRYLETIGQLDHYVPLDSGSRRDVLTRFAAGSETYKLVTVDGKQLDFSRDGLLVDFRNKVRQGSVLSYSNDPDPRLIIVSESLSLRRFTFAYDDAGRLSIVTDSTDRMVSFAYDVQGRLTSVTQPFLVDPATFNNGQVFQPGVTVPDNSAAGAISIVNVSRTAPIGQVIFNYCDIDYNRFEDLRVSLISPAGTEIIIRDHEPLPNGVSRFKLDDLSLASFEGENPQGQWRLKVVDNVAGGSNFNAEVSPYSIQFSGPTNPTFYTYDGANRLVEARDAAGNRIFGNTYDSLGRVASQEDGVDTNEPATFTYTDLSGSRLQTTFKDREGATSTFIHDNRLLLLSWTDPLGATTAFAYDSFGNRTSITDALGHQVRFEYDAADNLTAFIDAAGATTRMFHDDRRNLVRIRDALGKETTFEYDGNNNLTRVEDADGNHLVKTYNLRSQVLSTELHDGSKIGFGYDGDGDLSYATHPADEAQRADIEYDDLGRAIRITDAGKYVTRYEYSPSGQVLRESGPQNKETFNTYDVRDRLVSETDNVGRITAYEYDNNDNRVRVTNPLGHVTTYAYDGEDRLVAETDPLGRITRYSYDGLGRRLTITDPLGRTRSFTYDALGSAISEIAPSGVVRTTRTYDDRGLPTAIRDAFGHAVTSEYDILGRLEKLTDPLGRATTYGYDVLDRPNSVLDPLNRVVRIHYAPDDVTTRIETPGAADTVFEYDAANRLKRVLKGSYQWREYFYDDYRDLVTKEHTPTNLGINYEYDGLGRLLVLSGAGGRIDYTYDDAGNMVSSQGGPNTITRTYDALNRVTSVTNAGRTITYTYDGAGNLIRLTHPGGETIDYAYDAANRLVRATDWADRRTHFTYDLDDRITRIEFPNGTVRSMTYDKSGQVTRRVDTAPGGAIIVGYEFEYNPAGQVVAQHPLHASSSYAAAIVTMTYNDRYQVQTYNGGAISYSGDGQPALSPTGDGLSDITFLTNGNLSRIAGDRYEYNHEDRLVRIINASGTTHLLHNPHAGLSQIIEKADPDGTVTRYVYGVGLLYDVGDGEIRVYHYDNRGSTIALSDSAGNVSYRFNYGPFGEPFPGNDSSVTPFLFAGLYGVFTEPHGLCNMRTRWYSPLLRRYLSRDSYLGDPRVPTTLNTWAYALNNPLAYEDPEGEFINIVVGAIAGAIGGVVVQGISDLVQGREPRWQDYVSAAAGGALTGALIGSGGGAIVAGLAGAALTNSLNQGLNIATGDQTEFDVGSFALETAIGGVGGAVGGRFGRAAQGVVGPAWRKQVVYQGLLYYSKAAVRQGAARQIASTIFYTVATQAASALGVELGKRELNRLSLSRPEVTIADRSRQRYQAVRAYVEQNLRKVRGEYLHFEVYREALSLAGLPLPATPNNTLAQF